MIELIFYNQDQTFHYLMHIYVNKSCEVLASDKRTIKVYSN